MSPRPGTPVIHPRMLSALATIAEDAQTGKGQLLQPGPVTFNPTTGQDEHAYPTVLFTGSCRVQIRGRRGAAAVEAGEEPVRLPDFQISIPLAAPAAVGLVWAMTECTDLRMVGLEFAIIEVGFGTLEAERLLLCTLNETHV